MKLDEKHLVRLVDKWRDVLGLGTQWSIGVKVNRRHKEAAKGYRSAYAFTEVEEAYFQADISFNEYRFDGKDAAFLDLVACHEVCHIAFHKHEKLIETALGDSNEKLAEILTENLAEIVSRALVQKCRCR